MREFINANETIRESDSKTIQAAIQAACEDGCRKAVVPRYNKRTGGTKWMIFESIKLPHDFTLILDNCWLEQDKGAYDNMFTNEFADCGDYLQDASHVVKNITILGEGNVTCSGGEHNHLLEKTQDELGLVDSIWYNTMFLWWNVDGLRVENLHIEDQRWWAITHIMTKNVVIRNIDFHADPHVPNMDGIDMRLGCDHFFIENITGRTGDDIVACTGLVEDNHLRYLVKDKSLDICNIHFRNIKGDGNQCYSIRLLNHDGCHEYDITVDTLMDTSDPFFGKRPGAAVTIGSPSYEWLFKAKKGDTHDIHMKNIYSRGCHAFMLNHVLNDSTFENIHTFCPSTEQGVSTMGRGLWMDNVTVDHMYYSAFNPYTENSSAPKAPYKGNFVNMTKSEGNVLIKNSFCDAVKNAVNVNGGMTVTLENVQFADKTNWKTSDEISTVIVDGETK